MEKSQSDEIDLLELAASFFASLKRNIWITVLFPLSGILLALIFSWQSNDLLESSILVETSLLTEKECKFLFDQLDKAGVVPRLTAEQDRKVVSFKFEVSKNDGPIINGKNAFLSNKSVFLQVSVKVSDVSVFPALEKALVEFINESGFVTRHRSERQKFYSDMIKRIDQEIALMDEVKSQVNSSTQATSLNPSDLYANTIRLYEDKIEYEIKLKEIEVVHLVKGFDSLTVDAKMIKLVVASIGFVIGFIILCIVLFLKFFVRYYRLYETTH